MRYTQLAADPRNATYFTDSWKLVQPHTKAWDLPSMLIKPVQRVLKYPLLLDDLLKCTPPDHPDYRFLQMAAVQIKAVADEINEVKRKRETVDSIIQGGRSRDVSGASIASSTTASKPKRGVFGRKGDRASPGGTAVGGGPGGKGSTTGASSLGSTAVSQFSMKEHEKLRQTEPVYAQLVQRFMDAENTAKKLIKIVGSAGVKAKDLWLAQRQMVEDWRRIINLNGYEPVEDIRIEAYRDVVYQILEGPCSNLVRCALAQ